MFEVGQKVVCVDADPQTYVQLPVVFDSHLAEGVVYTVREVLPCVWDSSQIAVRLMEITRRSGYVIANGVHQYCPDAPYRATRFRPVKTTCIDVFLKMLEPTPETVT